MPGEQKWKRETNEEVLLVATPAKRTVAWMEVSTVEHGKKWTDCIYT
jgi:hypothetical protein